MVLWWGRGRFNQDGGSNLGYERAPDAAGVPSSLVSGRDFTLENLSLYVPPDYQTVIDGQENVRVRQVRVRIDHYWTLHTQRHEGWVARLGNNCAVTDCDLQAKGGGISPGRHNYIARNRVTAGKTPCPLGGARQVIVEDNGRGFDPAGVSTTSDGLFNMRQRLTRIGGEALITRPEAGGTRVEFSLPLAEA